jgi:lia operon protein LiaG
MKTLLRISSMVFCAILLAYTGAIAQTKTLVDTEKVFEGVRKIELEGGSLDIEYKGNDNMTKVSVSAFLESNQYDQDIVFVVVGDVLKISHRRNDSFKINSYLKTNGFIKVNGPTQIELIARSGSGKGYFENIKSEKINLAVGSGIIEGKKLTGDLSATAGSGTIKISELIGDLSCKIGSGDGTIQQTSGKTKAVVSSGSIKIKDSNLVHVTLSSGSGKLENIKEIGEITLSSGHLKATNSGLGGETKLTASSGSITIQSPSNLDQFNYNMRASSGNIKIGDRNAGKDLRIKNGDFPEINGTVSSGSIKITN